MTIRLRTLGSLAVSVNGTDRMEMRGRPVRLAILLYLALEREVSRDTVLALLWPESDEVRARQALRQTLYALKQDLGDEWLATGHETLRATSSLTADVGEVLEAMESGRPERVAELYRGPFLEGFHVSESQPFQLWCDQWRARLERLNRRARRALIDGHLNAGDPNAALGEARQWLDLDPLEDEAQHRVIELLFRLGRGKEALREYEAYAALLAREGLEPLDDTRTLVAEMRASSAGIPPLSKTSGPEERPPSWVRDGATEKHRLPLRHITVTAFAVVAIGSGLLLLGKPFASGPTLEPERVLVLPPRNETGDPTLDDLGLLAQAWITHGVAHMGTLRAVPSPDVLQMVEAGMTGEEAAVARRAGTLVTGRFFRVGDSLELHVQISNVGTGELWHALDPVRLTEAGPETGLRELRDRVAGSLAVRFIPGTALPEPSLLDPPTYPAFQAVMDGAEFVARGDWAGALPHMERAARLDTTFYRARLYLVAGLYNLGEHARADSVLDALASSRDRFSEYERLVFQSARGALRGDWDGRLAASREAAILDPGGTLHYISAGVALAAGRPREALKLYSTLDPHCPWAPEFLTPWSDWTGAHHLLGLHEAELREALRARAHHPDRLEALYLELRALAALGQIHGIEERVGDARAMAPEPGWDAGRVFTRTAAELRAHGHLEDANRILAAGLGWYRARPLEERSEPRFQMGYVDALLMSGGLSEAEPLLASLRAEHPREVGILGRLGVLFTLQGKGEESREAVTTLEGRRGPYTFGAVEYWRAAVAAWSGEEEQAMSWLRRALEDGRPRGIELHADPFLEPLWNHPAFSLLVSEES